MKVLVIGGSKFIGLNLILKLSEYKHDITVINKDNRSNIFPDTVKHIKGNRKNHEEVKRVFKYEAFDVIFDICGFEPQDIDIFIDIFKDRIKQYIFCSTTSVYDFKKIRCFPIKENFPLKNESNSQDFEIRYGSNKVLCEEKLLLNGYFPVTIFRPSYVFGPYAYDYRVEYLLDRVIDGRTILIPQIGHNIVHFIHVYDLVDMFLSAMGNKDAYNQAYNAAGMETTTILNFIELCEDIIGRIVNIKSYNPNSLTDILTEEEINKITLTKVYPFSLYFDFLKAKNELNWNPKFNLSDGIRNTYEWYRNQNRKMPDYSLDDKVMEYLNI